jgi:hypothetical protein
MAQAVSYCPTEGQVQYQASLCGICNIQSGTRKKFSHFTSIVKQDLVTVYRLIIVPLKEWNNLNRTKFY